MKKVLFATVLALAGAGTSTLALAEPAGGSDGRYTMSPSDGGFVRLDRQTGAMAFCSRRDEIWRCDSMDDAQSALRDEIARLESENKRLEADKKHLEEMLGLGDKPGEPGVEPNGAMKVPTEQDVDRMFDYIEGMVKKFKERIERLEEPKKDEQPL